jgi:hypothetical protein
MQIKLEYKWNNTISEQYLMKSLSENVTQSTMLNNKFIKEKEYKPDLLISLFLIEHDLFNI